MIYQIHTSTSRNWLIIANGPQANGKIRVGAIVLFDTLQKYYLRNSSTFFPEFITIIYFGILQ
jgi:hypothetical protein